VAPNSASDHVISTILLPTMLDLCCAALIDDVLFSHALTDKVHVHSAIIHRSDCNKSTAVAQQLLLLLHAMLCFVITC
jgi:hypothetical protein